MFLGLLQQGLYLFSFYVSRSGKLCLSILQSSIFVLFNIYPVNLVCYLLLWYCLMYSLLVFSMGLFYCTVLTNQCQYIYNDDRYIIINIYACKDITILCMLLLFIYPRNVYITRFMIVQSYNFTIELFYKSTFSETLPAQNAGNRTSVLLTMFIYTVLTSRLPEYVNSVNPNVYTSLQHGGVGG